MSNKSIDTIELEDFSHRLAIIDNISVQMLKEIYDLAYNDGFDSMASTEYPSDYETKGFDGVLKQVCKRNFI